VHFLALRLQSEPCGPAGVRSQGVANLLSVRFSELNASNLPIIWDLGIDASCLMTTPTKCSQSGPDCLMACVIADSKVVLEIECLFGNAAANVYLPIIHHSKKFVTMPKTKTKVQARPRGKVDRLG
jgi:hypothetical protein